MIEFPEVMHIRYKMLFLLLLVGFIFIGGCIKIANYTIGTEEYKRTVTLSRPFASGRTLEVESFNGHISAVGRDITTCDITATISAHAKTKDEAKRIAEKTDISLVPDGSGFLVKVESPPGSENQTPGVSFDIEMPKQAGVKFLSHNGRISVTGINGDIDITGYNGALDVNGISDSQCKLLSHNGRISFGYADNARPTKDIDLSTYNGNIDLNTPTGFSADIDAATHNGSISTSLPVTMKGKMDKNMIRGTIGKGGIRVKLETHNGSIEIR